MEINPALACICGGWIELLALLGVPVTYVLTKFYNKCKRPCCKGKEND